MLFAACTTKWEYKFETIEGSSYSKFKSNSFNTIDLEALGREGWELVDVYTINETVHPNFGNSEYVTGIRENTRTKSITYVFKRPK